MDRIRHNLNAPSLPEQLFGDSLLRLSHLESGITLGFTAQDALKAWKADERPPVRVEMADEWLKSRERDVQASGAITLDYDW